MRLVSLNAWGGACWDALGGWLKGLEADVLCLQEVTRAPQSSPDWLVYEDAARRLDQRANLFDDVSRTLPDHQGFFAPAARGFLHDGQGGLHSSEHGIAFWVHRRLALTGLHHGFAFGAFRPDGWGAEPVPRSLQLARILVPEWQQTLVFGHFHGLRHPLGKGDLPERHQQARRVIRAVKGFVRDPVPIVLAGDWNILPDNPFFEDMARMGLQSLVRLYGISDTRTSLYAKPQRHANYVLANDLVPVARFAAPSEPVVSDHRALVLDLEG